MTPDEVDTLIGANVRGIRSRLRMRQEDLADAIGWARRTVTTLEAGDRRVTMSDVMLLCEALEVDLAELLRGAPADALRRLGLAD